MPMIVSPSVLAVPPLLAMTIHEIRGAAKPLLGEVAQMTQLP